MMVESPVMLVGDVVKEKRGEFSDVMRGRLTLVNVMEEEADRSDASVFMLSDCDLDVSESVTLMSVRDRVFPDKRGCTSVFVVGVT